MSRFPISIYYHLWKIFGLSFIFHKGAITCRISRVASPQRSEQNKTTSDRAQWDGRVLYALLVMN